MNTVPGVTKVDFHTHCLPGIDDGAADTGQALAMLRDSARQGIDLVLGTPHFYWGRQAVPEFVNRRTEAWHSLQAAREQAPDGDALPSVLPGAEVLICEGISRLDLQPLCIMGTNVLLVELPFRAPPVWLNEELETIVFDQKLQVLLAHVDRYIPWYSAEKMEELLELPGVTAQINADALLERRTRHDLYRRMPRPKELALGSDMHNMESRPSHIAQAMQALGRGFSSRPWVAAVQRYETRFLEALRSKRPKA